MLAMWDRYIESSRQYGKSLHQLQTFISSVEEGKRDVLFGPGYVVMSQKVYKDLVDKIPAGDRIVAVDELKGGDEDADN